MWSLLTGREKGTMLLALFLFLCHFCTFLNGVVGERPQTTEMTVSGEYCENESMKAVCGQDEVIVIESALYGRMNVSRCVDRDYGYVGCYTDVRLIADRKCSGRRTCEIGVPHPDFSQDCPRDLKPYLQATYRCVKIVDEQQICQKDKNILVTKVSGYLSSVVTQDTNKGSPLCPWEIRADEGQYIVITLLDFTRSERETRRCDVYAIIRDSQQSNSVRICGVLGCKTPQTSEARWVVRSYNHVTIGCTNTDDEWHLICDGQNWKGNIGNCSLGGLVGDITPAINDMSIPMGLSIGFISCIALLVGIVTLTIGIACIKWKKGRLRDSGELMRRASTDFTYRRHSLPAHVIAAQLAHKQSISPLYLSGQVYSHGSENGYEYIDDVTDPARAHSLDIPSDEATPKIDPGKKPKSASEQPSYFVLEPKDNSPESKAERRENYLNETTETDVKKTKPEIEVKDKDTSDIEVYKEAVLNRLHKSIHDFTYFPKDWSSQTDNPETSSNHVSA